MSTVVIREAGSMNDRFQIQAMFGVFGVFGDGPKELKGRPWVHIVYVVEDIKIPETGMLGYIHAKVFKETDTNKVTKHHGYITVVIVRRLFQRSGLATKLITVVENDMKQKWNTDYITVNVPKTKLAAKHLFEHNNYTLDHEDEDAYHFLKQLKWNEVDSCSEKTKRRRHDGSSSSSSSSHVTKGKNIKIYL
ncbi:N-terminal acetyltransferase A complex catalytic subunit NAA10 [Trifolium repens]|nr:N-terminal acetyltransferase A complex catalytic subunit NAA10 [Trifolium repens]